MVLGEGHSGGVLEGVAEYVGVLCGEYIGVILAIGVMEGCLGGALQAHVPCDDSFGL